MAEATPIPPTHLEGHMTGSKRDGDFLKLFGELVTELEPEDDFVSNFSYRLADDIVFSAEPEIPHIDFLRRLVVWAAMEMGLSEDVGPDVGLCFEEAVANVIRHSYPTDQPKWVLLRLSRQDDEVVFELKDKGEYGRNPDLVEAITGVSRSGRPPLRRQGGGLGLYLIRRLMDDVTYEIEQYNTLTMRKRLKNGDADGQT